MRADPDRLQELVDRGAIDQPLALVSAEEIADAWWRHTLQAGKQSEPGPHWWAVELLVDEPIYRDRDAIRRVLQALAERAPDGADLRYLGAGPLENFCAADEETVAWIEEEAQRSPRFRAALAGMWVSDLPPAAVERLERAAGVALARARPQQNAR